MSVVPDIALESISATGELASYARLLRVACSESPPPFGMKWYGEKYRSLACEPEWLARSLVLNAEKEAAGSEALWHLAGSIAQQDISHKVRLHAIDESRHAKLYILL